VDSRNKVKRGIDTAKCSSTIRDLDGKTHLWFFRKRCPNLGSIRFVEKYGVSGKKFPGSHFLGKCYYFLAFG